MRSFSVALRVAGFAALAVTLIDCDGANEVDTILRGAIVYDGSGSAGRRADVAIDDGEIVPSVRSRTCPGDKSSISMDARSRRALSTSIPTPI